MPGGGDEWEPGAATLLDEPGGRVRVTIADERGKLDINQVPPGLLQALFGILGADRDTASKVANAVADWRAPQPAGNGPDSPLVASYRTAGLAYGPNGAEFQRIDELRLVQGMTPALYQASLPYLTMALEQGPWLKLAGPVVLAAMAKAKRDSGLSLENADSRGPIVLRITAQATGPNGAAFTRRVLFRLDGTLSGPAWKYRILSWDDGPDPDGPGPGG
jgi:general secretion pathway protein K